MRALLRKRTRRLNLEALEKRDVPATWGIAWPVADHLTLSFMPDGSSVQGQASQLFGTLDGQLGAGKWKSAILDAFQTWAANSNINIGLVADAGQAQGVAGPAQGDARFGDIRVSAVPLPAGVVAITSPYDPGTGTVSGDMILNSNVKFNTASGYDLFTVALHEAGHSFGFADSSDPSSFMYDVYTGPVAGLAPGAIPALQDLYGGPRDLTDQDGNPDASNPKKPVDVTSLITAGLGANTVAGDLDSLGTVNYYQFKAPALNVTAAGVDILVQTAGLSQLVPRVTVTDSSGNRVAVAAASSTADGGVIVHLLNLSPGKTYSIRVDAPSSDLHSIGSYVLALASSLTITGDPAGMKTATSLDPKAGASQGPTTGMVSIAATIQADYYSFTTPAATPYGFTARLQAFGVGLIASQLVVLNGQGAIVGRATAGNWGSPAVSVHINGAMPNTKYYLKVISGVVNSSQFGIYQASVSYAASAAAVAAPILQTPWLGTAGAKLSGPNTSLSTAATLQTPAGYKKGSFYAAMEGISTAGVANYFDINLPTAKQGAYMTLSVQALNGSSFVPWVTVYDGSGNLVPAQVLTQANGISVVQVPCGPKTKDYVVKVAASGANGGGSTGNYYLNATFGTDASSLEMLASGTTAVAASTSVTTPSTQLYEFVLAGDPSNASTGAMLRMTVTDSSGHVVATLTSLATEAASLNLLLAAGRYSLAVDVYRPSGGTAPTVLYSLTGTNLTDPIKVYPSPGGGGSGTRC